MQILYMIEPVTIPRGSNSRFIILQNARARSNFGEMSTPQSITH